MTNIVFTGAEELLLIHIHLENKNKLPLREGLAFGNEDIPVISLKHIKIACLSKSDADLRSKYAVLSRRYETYDFSSGETKNAMLDKIFKIFQINIEAQYASCLHLSHNYGKLTGKFFI